MELRCTPQELLSLLVNDDSDEVMDTLADLRKQVNELEGEVASLEASILTMSSKKPPKKKVKKTKKK